MPCDRWQALEHMQKLMPTFFFFFFFRESQVTHWSRGLIPVVFHKEIGCW
jgi:hypothetical protein